MSGGYKLWIVTFLTLVRVPLVLLFFAGAIVYSEYRHTWIFVLTFASLVSSAVTDAFDGWLARRFKVETDFVAHADPLMDKFFYLATFPLLVYISTRKAFSPGHDPFAPTHAILLLILTLLFLGRDQWVTFLRSIGSMYNVSGRAHWSGKLRTIITFPLACAIYFFEESPWQFFAPWALYTFEAIAFVINFVSLWVYTRNYWPYLRQSAQLKV